MSAAPFRLDRRLLLATAAALPLAPFTRRVAAQEADAAALLRRAATVMADLRSFHFELSTPQGATQVMEAFELVGVEGDVLRPDRYRATVEARAAVVELSLEVIGIGDRVWISDPTSATGGFVELPMDEATSPEERLRLANLLNPDVLWLAALSLVTDAAVVGENSIDGEPVTRVDGVLDLARIAAFAPSEAGGAAEAAASLPRLPVSVWLTASGHLRRLEAEGAILEGEAPDVVRRLDLTRFDEPVTIEPPEESRAPGLDGMG